jgi:hypothetical protein
MNVIHFKMLERGADGEPEATFAHPALARRQLGIFFPGLCMAGKAMLTSHPQSPM